jgi:hypothetical protein
MGELTEGNEHSPGTIFQSSGTKREDDRTRSKLNGRTNEPVNTA